MQAFIPYLNSVGRILIAAIFLISGVSKISGFEATQGYMAAMGVPGALALDNRRNDKVRSV